MTIEQISQIATAIAALAVPLLVWQSFLLRKQVKANATQLSLTAKTVKATLDGQIFARLDAINNFSAQHFELYKGLYKEFDSKTELSDDPTHLAADIALTFYEHVFNIREKYETMDENEWESWECSMKQALKPLYFKGYWKDRARENYKPKYRDFIDKLLKDT